MKSLKTLFGIWMISTVAMPFAFADAGHEGPNGMPALPALLAEKVTSGGFVANPEARTLRIYVDGRVVKIVRSLYVPNAPSTQTMVAQLSSEVVSNLLKATSQIQLGDLVDREAGKPMCTDTPTVSYFSYTPDSTQIKFAVTESCHHWKIPSVWTPLIFDTLNTFDEISR